MQISFSLESGCLFSVSGVIVQQGGGEQTYFNCTNICAEFKKSGMAMNHFHCPPYLSITAQYSQLCMNQCWSFVVLSVLHFYLLLICHEASFFGFSLNYFSHLSLSNNSYFSFPGGSDCFLCIQQSTCFDEACLYQSLKLHRDVWNNCKTVKTLA